MTVVVVEPSAWKSVLWLAKTGVGAAMAAQYRHEPRLSARQHTHTHTHTHIHTHTYTHTHTQQSAQSSRNKHNENNHLRHSVQETSTTKRTPAHNSSSDSPNTQHHPATNSTSGPPRTRGGTAVRCPECTGREAQRPGTRLPTAGEHRHRWPPPRCWSTSQGCQPLSAGPPMCHRTG